MFRRDAGHPPVNTPKKPKNRYLDLPNRPAPAGGPRMFCACRELSVSRKNRSKISEKPVIACQWNCWAFAASTSPADRLLYASALWVQKRVIVKSDDPAPLEDRSKLDPPLDQGVPVPVSSKTPAA